MTDHRARIAFDAALLGLLALALAAIAADVSVLRPVAVALALLLVPGGAVLTRLPVDDVATAAGLAVGLSLALEVLLAALLAATHLWAPAALGAVLGGAAAVLLAADLVRAGPAGARSGAAE